MIPPSGYNTKKWLFSHLFGYSEAASDELAMLGSEQIWYALKQEIKAFLRTL